MLNGDSQGTKDRRPPDASNPSSEPMVRLRFMVAALGVVLWALVIALRLIQLQVLEHREFAVRARRQSERTVSLDPRRGPILDRQGRPLAVSVEVESVYADPQNIGDAEATAEALGRALRLRAKERRSLLVQLQRDRAFAWVKRKVDPTLARAVKALKLPGVGFLTETRRYYPKRELAAQLIGYAGIDNIGMWGIEYAFDDELRGREAKVVVRTDAHRRPVGYTERPSTEGLTVVLTIDEAIQHVVEQELDRAVQETSSRAGMAVVLDPTSGEIMALANRPTFNPNRFWIYNSSHWRNRAVVDAFEPGSVFKIVTAAAALEERVVDPDEIIDCGHGSIEVGGQSISDHAVFDDLRFREVIAYSSCVGVARVAQRLGRRSFARYIAEFGFGAPTGVALPGESRGIVRPPERWSARSLATIAFGQEVGVTALQMACAVSTVANGGYLMQPLIVRRIENRDGDVVKAFRPVVIRRVLEPSTADTMTEMLKGVVRFGTGKSAALPGYPVAGKTGTAQKLNASGGYSSVDHFASFVGFVPANRPAVVILVSLDTPRGSRNQGGDAAAPVFARIAERSLRRLAIPAEDPRRFMRVALNDSSMVTATALETGASKEPVPAVMTAGVMPDLRGRSAREAAVTAARHGLVVELRGSGRVSRQDPKPGSFIKTGDTCVLTLMKDPEPSDSAEGRGA